MVSEIQAPIDREGLPLTNEVLVWPKENTLCLPRFITQFNEDIKTSSPSLSDDNSGSSLQEQFDTHSEHPPLTSQSSESGVTNTSNTMVEEAPVVFPELPESREGLLELRAQLSMELLWVKQAIASRQEVSVLVESSGCD